jgi:CheY-like chemotaxis protein
VLYVEDNPSNVFLMEEVVNRLPEVQLISAHTGELGIALAKQERPDLVIMDINLPGIDGLEALSVLRHDPLTAAIPVMALTANALASDIERGLAAGFDAYETKPIQITAFTQVLRDMLFGHHENV